MTRGVVLRTAIFALAVALSAVAVWLVVSSPNSVRRMQLGVLAGLWAAMLGAFAMFGTRKLEHATEAAGSGVSPGRELARRSEHAELERLEETAARRAHEARLEHLVRREIQTSVAREVDGLRAEIAQLRGDLLEKVGGQLRLERIETTRVIGSDLEALQHELRELKYAAQDTGELRVAAVRAAEPALRQIVEPARVRPVSRETANTEADVQPARAVREPERPVPPAAPVAAPVAAPPAAPAVAPVRADAYPPPASRIPPPSPTLPRVEPEQPRVEPPPPTLRPPATGPIRATPGVSMPAVPGPPPPRESVTAPPPVAPSAPAAPPAGAPSTPSAPDAPSGPDAPSAPAAAAVPAAPSRPSAPYSPSAPYRPSSPPAPPAPSAPFVPASDSLARSRPSAPPNDDFAALPRIRPFTDFELDPVEDEPSYTGRRRRVEDPAASGRHAEPEAPLPTPAAAESQRRRRADADGDDLLARLLARDRR